MALKQFQNLRVGARGEDIELQKTLLRSIENYYRFFAERLIKEHSAGQAVQVLKLARDQQFFDLDAGAFEPRISRSNREQEFEDNYEGICNKIRQVDLQINLLNQQAFDRPPTESEVSQSKNLEAELESEAARLLSLSRMRKRNFPAPRTKEICSGQRTYRFFERAKREA